MEESPLLSEGLFWVWLEVPDPPRQPKTVRRLVLAPAGVNPREAREAIGAAFAAGTPQARAELTSWSLAADPSCRITKIRTVDTVSGKRVLTVLAVRNDLAGHWLSAERLKEELDAIIRQAAANTAPTT